MANGTAARIREVETVKVQEYHMKILAPGSTRATIQLLVSDHPHPWINVGDRVENMVLDKTKLPSPANGLVVTCVHHSLNIHLGKTCMTTCLQTDARGPFE
jgi:hypothetical protein